MEKLIRDGKVAVVINERNFWSSDVRGGRQVAEILCMDKRIAEAVESGMDSDDVEELAYSVLEEELGEEPYEDDVYRLGSRFFIQWIPVGHRFFVNQIIHRDDYSEEAIDIDDEKLGTFTA